MVSRPRVITEYKVASNPVAKAIARRKVTTALLSIKLRAFSKPRFEDCTDLLQEASWVLVLIAGAAELDPDFGKDHPMVRVMRGGLSAIHGMSKTNKWDPDQAVAVERALTEAESLNLQIKQKFIWDSLKRMQS